jgi:hexosaminidase
VPLFPGPYLHIGADETFELGQGQSKDLAAQVGIGQVYFDHVKRVAEILAPYNKKLMFWGDIALRYPQLLPQLPKGMIAMTWNYSARPNFDAQLKPFKDAGLDVVICPGVNNWNRIFPNLDQALPNIRDFARDGLKYGVLGMMNTTWDDDGEGLFGLAWYPVVFGAAAAWQPSADVNEFAKSFDWAFFRNAEGTPFADAIAKLNSVNTLLSKSGAGDANDSVFWLNPFIPAQRRTLDRILPVARDVRLAAESAIETVDKNASRAHRNADLLEYLRLAGYRLDYVGMKSLYMKQISDLYTEAYNAQQPPQTPPTQQGAPGQQNPQGAPGAQNRQAQARPASSQNIGRITGMNGLLQDFRDQSTLLRKMYEAAWLAENRPHWLGNVLALYDRETQMWLDKARELSTRRGTNGRMATPEELGFAVSTPATPGNQQR